jgi:hypothetical protein
MLRSETTVLATVYTSGHWTYFTGISNRFPQRFPMWPVVTTVFVCLYARDYFLRGFRRVESDEALKKSKSLLAALVGTCWLHQFRVSSFSYRGLGRLKVDT